MASLTTLSAGMSGISDLHGLEFAINLTSLSLGGNAISDLSPLAGLHNLTGLWLTENQITDIWPLANLTNLEGLFLMDNQISYLGYLTNLTNLVALDLGYTGISDIGPLSNLKNLTYLSLFKNHISDLSPLTGLSDLDELLLQVNDITDLSPLVSNAGLDSGDSIDVSENLLDPAPGTTDRADIDSLQARGVIVDYDAQRSVVSIPDASLEAAVRAELSLPTGDIAVADMEKLTTLTASGLAISNLEGLQYAKNLNTLDLSANEIVDLTPLSGLSGLSDLLPDYQPSRRSHSPERSHRLDHPRTRLESSCRSHSTERSHRARVAISGGQSDR